MKLIKNLSSKDQNRGKKFLKYKYRFDSVLSNLFYEQKGSAIILVVLILPVLLGFTAIAIDAGIIYMNKTQLQTMADAGALAGAKDLHAGSTQAILDKAKADGESFAYKNGLTSDTVTAKDPVIKPDNYSLEVEVSREVDLIFAKIFNKDNTLVKASAIATVTPAGGATGVVPIGVEKENFVFAEQYILKEGGGGGNCGNYGALALGQNGGSNFEFNLRNGYNGLLNPDDWVITEPGAMSGPTGNQLKQGLQDRINSDPLATFETVQSGSRRLVVVPIIKTFAGVHGRSSVQIESFAIFFIESVDHGEVTGRFLQMTSGGATEGPGKDYGLYNVRLTK